MVKGLHPISRSREIQLITLQHSFSPTSSRRTKNCFKTSRIEEILVKGSRGQPLQAKVILKLHKLQIYISKISQNTALNRSTPSLPLAGGKTSCHSKTRVTRFSSIRNASLPLLRLLMCLNLT